MKKNRLHGEIEDDGGKATSRVSGRYLAN